MKYNESDIYGYLYNWHAVDDSRNIAPLGWHVPTDEEWKELELALGMSQSEADVRSMGRDTNEGSKFAGRSDLWAAGHLKNNVVFDEIGFSALPGGYRSGIIDPTLPPELRPGFHELNFTAIFWSSTEAEIFIYFALDRRLFYFTSKIGRKYQYKQNGLSVRLVRD